MRVLHFHEISNRNWVAHSNFFFFCAFWRKKGERKNVMQNAKKNIVIKNDTKYDCDAGFWHDAKRLSFISIFIPAGCQRLGTVLYFMWLSTERPTACYSPVNAIFSSKHEPHWRCKSHVCEKAMPSSDPKTAAQQPVVIRWFFKRRKEMKTTTKKN